MNQHVKRMLAHKCVNILDSLIKSPVAIKKKFDLHETTVLDKITINHITVHNYNSSGMNVVRA